MNREGSTIAILADSAQNLRAWLNDETIALKRCQMHARVRFNPKDQKLRKRNQSDFCEARAAFLSTVDCCV